MDITYVSWMAKKHDLLEVTFDTFKHAWQSQHQRTKDSLRRCPEEKRFGMGNGRAESHVQAVLKTVMKGEETNQHGSGSESGESALKAHLQYFQIDAPPPTASGLFNEGNSCYMHSMLQVLARSGAVRSILRSDVEANTSGAWPPLAALLYDLDRDDAGSCIRLTALVRHIRELAMQEENTDIKQLSTAFDSKTQEDNEEFFRYCKTLWQGIEVAFPIVRLGRFIQEEACKCNNSTFLIL
jgi:uncharacterized UBP type Zn finger protein